MTWYWDEDGEDTIRVWDHNGEKVSSGREHSGWGVNGYPSEVTDVMRETFEYESSFGNSPVMGGYAGQILLNWIDEDIERGQP